MRRLAVPGNGQAVLYIHGFNDYFFQKEMAFRFNERGIHFYALDLRKYGRSWLPHQKFNDIRNLRAYYEEIGEALRIIREEGSRYTFHRKICARSEDCGWIYRGIREISSSLVPRGMGI